MSLSLNGQSRVPPGFRFHPTEEELLHYYLRKKVASEKIDFDVIRDVDLNKLEPWDIQEKCRIGSTPQNDWYFFSHKDKKYPTGTRTNRATAAGFWKATGRDKVIYSSFSRLGMRKTLVFYTGRAPHGQKSDWIMHEYRLDDTTTATSASHMMEETNQEDGWVVCRIFKKKNNHKNLDSGSSSLITATVMRAQMLNSGNDEGLNQILIHGKFMQPSRLESLTLQSLPNNSTWINQASSNQSCYQAMDIQVFTDTEASVTDQGSCKTNPVYNTEPGIKDWAALDRLVASQLSGQAETSNDPNMSFYSSPDEDLQLPRRHSFRSCHSSQDYNDDEIDLWSHSLDPLCHM